MTADILSYMEVALVDGLYEPPIALDTLAKAVRANPMHGSALYVKSNMASSSAELSPLIKRREFKRFMGDFLTFGNGYFSIVRNRLGDVVEIKHLPALYMRRKENINEYVYKPREYSDEGRVDYKAGQVFHLGEYDVCQEIYGLPQYIGALSSIWLNEDATLFRRKYYLNGSHAGYLLYMNDPNLTGEQEKDIKDKLSKKIAFKNLFINGKGKDGKAPELTPIGQVEAKDEFKNIKSKTTEDVLASHRIPLDLMSIVREGFASSSDLNKVDRVFYKNELVPLLEQVCELNDFVGMEVITIKEYTSLEPEGQ
ncbi:MULTISPECIES: phage portal protein [Vibrio]|uniref:phage portal protein n=1 Tax=Vibrio TaxID=662 RepID=UPI000B5CFF64|nr:MULTISPECIES: phage portal protein [Vibrio]HBV77653.1 phage portal protein [Vibrio sp.]